MKVIIVGCGRVGSTLARKLDEEGHEVTVIDLNESQFSRLGENFTGKTIKGTGIDEDVLRSAGIEEADAFVAATNGDNRNIMASQIAKEIFKVPHVITRIYDPIRADMYRELGIDTIPSTTIIVGIIHDRIIKENQGS